MARQRIVPSNFPNCYRVNEVNREARYFKIMLGLIADDQGRFVVDFGRWPPKLFPGDTDAPSLIPVWYRALEHIGEVESYTVDRVTYGRLVHWHDEQTVCHPTESVLPPSPNEDPEDSRISRKAAKRGRRGRNGEADQGVNAEAAEFLESTIFFSDEVDAPGLVKTFKSIGANAAAAGSHTAALKAAMLVAQYGGIKPAPVAASSEAKLVGSQSMGRSPDQIMMDEPAPHERFGLPATAPVPRK